MFKKKAEKRVVELNASELRLLVTALMNFSEQAQRAMQPNGAWIELDPYEMRILIEE